MNTKILQTTFALLISSLFCQAQTGSEEEPVRYIGGVTADPTLHEARLPYAVGVENIQVVRSNRTHPEMAEDFGWTYNHAPNMAYWNGQFYLQYLSNPKDEHVAPGHTLLVTSKDGIHWNKPVEAFPPYEAPEGVEIPEGYHGYMMHQRMGFYTAPNGKFLNLAFYGHTDKPFKKGGIGRVVREIKKDGSFGPIYFIRYSSYTDWGPENTSYPFYTESKDKEFVAACESLLNDKLATLQWLDEDSGNDDFFTALRPYKDSIESPSIYHREDGKAVALWKFSMVTISDDEGVSFSDPVKAPTLLMAGGKNWGQKTDDGRYAMVYNPIETQEYRFPLIVISGDDGIVFDNMALVHAEVPARRFYGRWKDFGPNYTRGITENNGNPPGEDMWVTYSVNKEDIWVSRIPLPIRHELDENVNDTFDDLEAGASVPNWNLYKPVWAPAEIAKSPDTEGNALKLADKDPYDYARAIRVFKEGQQLNAKFKVFADQNNSGMLDIEIADQFGNRPVQLRLDEKGNLVRLIGEKEEVIQAYKGKQWYEMEISVNTENYGSYSLTLNGKKVLDEVPLSVVVKSVERISFRTGEFRNLPNRKTPNQSENPPSPLEGADDPVQEAVFYIDDVNIEAK